MSDSTSILDLPTDPVGGGNIGGVVSLSATENVTHLQSGQTPNFSLDQTTINQIVNGLQQASATGATQLPSRDIPITTTNIMNDPQIQPNYVPIHERNTDYIKNYEDSSDMIDNYNKNNQYNNSIDDMYNEIQTPLLMSVLYFLFQLPFFKKFLFGYFPVLFSKDGNLNLYGFSFNSVLFGLLFYLLNKFSQNFNKF
jgi:hypothetical protein